MLHNRIVCCRLSFRVVKKIIVFLIIVNGKALNFNARNSTEKVDSLYFLVKLLEIRLVSKSNWSESEEIILRFLFCRVNYNLKPKRLTSHKFKILKKKNKYKAHKKLLWQHNFIERSL